MRNNLLLDRFLRDERGATAIEYGLIAAGISLVILAVVMQIGQQLKTNYFEKMGAGLS